MFFLFSKLFHFLLVPITWIIIFLIISITVKSSVSKKKYALASLFLFIFFSNTFIFDRFMQAWEVRAVADGKVPECDAGILLTGMATFDPEINRLEFNDRTDRLMQAIKLFHEQNFHTLILCGGPVTISGNDTLEGSLLKNYLIQTGIPEEKILLETKSRNTYENAFFLKPMLDKNFPGGKFLLITSAAHMTRATACFRKAGIPVIPYATDRYSGPTKFDFDYLFFPSSATLFNWEKLIHEWLGVIVYRIMGYV